MKYTREDVIVWEDDERLENLEEGDEIWVGDNYRWLLEQANENRIPDLFVCVDPTCDNTFVFKASYGISAAPFMIIKKEPKKKIVPFDLSLEEDRNALIGKRIKSIATDMIVTDFACRCGYGWQVRIAPELGFDGEFLYAQFVFADGENKGKPVGKEVEE